jgi:hypothetical protein
MMAISRQNQLQLSIIQKTPCFVSCYDLVEKRPIFVRTVNQVTAGAHVIVTLALCQDTWNTMLGIIGHVQVIRHNLVASPFCCDIINHLGAAGMHQHCNFLDLEFSSDDSWSTGILTIFPTVSSLCKSFMPLERSTVTQGFLAV